MKQTAETYCPPKIAFHLEYTLDADEIIMYVVKQKKSSLILWPEYLVATNKRLIFCIQEIFGNRVNSYEYLWKYIGKCNIIKRVTSTTLLVQLINGEQVVTNYLPNKQAVLLHNYLTKMITSK